MAHIAERSDGTNFWYFVTVVTLHRRPVFDDVSACRHLQGAFHEARRFLPFRLAGLVILPDHWHAMIRPGMKKLLEAGMQSCDTHQTVTIERVMGAVKRNVLRDLHTEGSTIWQ